jgi:hypothetical protein
MIILFPWESVCCHFCSSLAVLNLLLSLLFFIKFVFSQPTPLLDFFLFAGSLLQLKQTCSARNLRTAKEILQLREE